MPAASRSCAGVTSRLNPGRGIVSSERRQAELVRQVQVHLDRPVLERPDRSDPELLPLERPTRRDDQVLLLELDVSGQEDPEVIALRLPPVAALADPAGAALDLAADAGRERGPGPERGLAAIVAAMARPVDVHLGGEQVADVGRHAVTSRPRPRARAPGRPRHAPPSSDARRRAARATR